MIGSMTSHHAWSALSPAEARELFGGFQRSWWVAGGWAIDLFLGRQTRRHEDIDIAILRGDEVTMASMLAGWEICVAHDGKLTPWPGDRPLAMPMHQFWVRREAGGPWTFEVLLEDHDGAGTWRYRRDHRIAAPIGRFGRVSHDSIPYVAPEVALLYKARRHEVAKSVIEKSAADFAAALPALDDDARAWLRGALGAAHPGHPWVEVL
jgi:hypothetical protein